MKQENKENIANSLHQYRMDRLWTYQQLAEATGMSLGALFNIEKGNGKRKPHDLTVAKLKKRLPGFLKDK